MLYVIDIYVDSSGVYITHTDTTSNSMISKWNWTGILIWDYYTNFVINHHSTVVNADMLLYTASSSGQVLGMLNSTTGSEIF